MLFEDLSYIIFKRIVQDEEMGSVGEVNAMWCKMYVKCRWVGGCWWFDNGVAGMNQCIAMAYLNQ